MRKTLITLVLACAASAAMAQSTAIRFIIAETHKVYKLPKFDSYCMGVGVDRSFNDRLTLGFDVSFGVGHALSPTGQSVSLRAGGVDVSASMKPGLLSLNYHTEYALGDNGGTHVYIGTFLGLRRVSQKWLDDGMTHYDGSGNLVAFSKPADVSQWLVPIGLRMGLRGATDGGFMDLYGAVGYQIGGGKFLVPNANEGRYAETSALAVTLGLAYGIGW